MSKLKEKALNKTKIALLIIDMISDFEFEDGAELFKYALPMAPRIAELKKRAAEMNIPVVYVNDNYGKWQEDFNQMTSYLLGNETRGSRIAEIIAPEKDDFYVLKPKHSAFYSTSLEVLLDSLNIETLIITGISADICVLFTANDGYMRGYKVVIASDCVASVKQEEKEHALNYIQRVLKAELLLSEEIDFKSL